MPEERKNPLEHYRHIVPLSHILHPVMFATHFEHVKLAAMW
jgi:hypothetical protein